MWNKNSSLLWVYFLVSLEHNEGYLLNVSTEMKTGALQEDLHDNIVLQYESTFAIVVCPTAAFLR